MRKTCKTENPHPEADLCKPQNFNPERRIKFVKLHNKLFFGRSGSPNGFRRPGKRRFGHYAQKAAQILLKICHVFRGVFLRRTPLPKSAGTPIPSLFGEISSPAGEAFLCPGVFSFCPETFGAAREDSFRSLVANLSKKFTFSLMSVRGESGTERRLLSIPHCWIFAFAGSERSYRAWLSRL